MTKASFAKRNKAKKNNGMPASSKVQTQLRKAEASLRANDPDEAEKILNKVCREFPGATEAWLMLASVLGRQERFQEAEKCCGHVLTLAPDHPTVHSLLGSACTAQGKLDEGIKHLTQAVQLSPGIPGVLNNLGNALYAAGKIDEAALQFESALAISPGQEQADFGLGSCRLAQGRWNDALASFHRAYTKLPGNYDVNMSLGRALINLGDRENALDCFLRAARLTTHPGIALYETSRVLELQGQLDRALEYIQDALHEHPDDIDFMAQRAQILYKMGDTDQAHQEIRGLVDNGKFSPLALLAWGQFCGLYEEREELIPLAEAMIEDSKIGITDVISLHYLLGKLHDSGGKYDRAFDNYRRANSLLPADEFKQEAHAGMVASLKSGYTRKAFQNLAYSSCADKRPVFIVGMPRSGTSLVEQILASHPQIYGAGELEYIKELAGELFVGKGANFSNFLPTVDQKSLDNLAEKYLNLIDRNSGAAERVTDKMPGNYLWLGFISQLFPEARIIHCKRDPRDTCLSIYFQQFSKGHSYAQDLGDLAFYYRLYEELMTHWQSTLPIPVLEIQYERLVENHEDYARTMLDFLSLPWNDVCLEFHQLKRATATASWDQVRQPVYTRSKERWRHYQQYIEPLITEFGDEDLPR